MKALGASLRQGEASGSFIKSQRDYWSRRQDGVGPREATETLREACEMKRIVGEDGRDESEGQRVGAKEWVSEASGCNK